MRTQDNTVIIHKTANSFSEFENIVGEFRKSFTEKLTTSRPVFRGTQEYVDEGRFLQPSIEWKNLVQFEYELISEIKRLKPLQFNISGLDLIAKLQHYGIPTRLLDFSLSSYVALYFAVRNSLRYEQGAVSKVYCLGARISDVTAETIAQIPEKLQPHMFNADKNFFIENILFPKSSDEERTSKIRDFLHQVFTINVFTNPKFYTEREINQQSVFMILCNNIIDRHGIINFDSADWEEQIDKEPTLCNRFYFDTHIKNLLAKDMGNNELWEIEIANEAVLDIKAKLIELGINEPFLFPDDLEKTAAFVYENVKNRYNL